MDDLVKLEGLRLCKGLTMLKMTFKVVKNIKSLKT